MEKVKTMNLGKVSKSPSSSTVKRSLRRWILKVEERSNVFIDNSGSTSMESLMKIIVGHLVRL